MISEFSFKQLPPVKKRPRRSWILQSIIILAMKVDMVADGGMLAPELHIFLSRNVKANIVNAGDGTAWASNAGTFGRVFY